MKRSFAFFLVVTMLVLVFVTVPALFPATAAPSEKELAKETVMLRKRLHESSQRNIDKLVAAGELRPQDGKRLKKNFDVLHEWYLEHSLDDSALCPHCGDGKFKLRDHEYTEWLTVSYTRCSQTPWRNDQVQQRHVINILTCDGCGLNYCPLSLEFKVVCSN